MIGLTRLIHEMQLVRIIDMAKYAPHIIREIGIIPLHTPTFGSWGKRSKHQQPRILGKKRFKGVCLYLAFVHFHRKKDKRPSARLARLGYDFIIFALSSNKPLRASGRCNHQATLHPMWYAWETLYTFPRSGTSNRDGKSGSSNISMC